MLTLEALDILGNPALSAALWLLVAMVLLYLARRPAHDAIRATGRGVQNGLRLCARSVMIAERGLDRRNREVLFTGGALAAEHDLEREFERIGKTVERDVAALPGLQRQLAEQISALDEDYRQSSEVPPPPPGWVKAVTAVAELEGKGEAPVAQILGEIHRTTRSQHDTALKTYRDAVAERHQKLDRMLPRWRQVTSALEQTTKRAGSLVSRAHTVDQHMELYTQIRSETDAAERELTTSSLTQFVIAAVVLAIAVGGAIINFNLIALPMSEMVGGGSYIGSWKTSDVAALVIILVEVAMGLYLMESLRITRLFPVIGQMDDRTRVKMAWITFSLLLILAGIESSLALMRDRIAADMQALRQSLTAVEAVAMPTSKIPTIGQMVMGFILPFALTFVAIPLETFVHSGRNVLGAGLALFLRALAFMLRLGGNAARALGELLVAVYDVVIFLPLWFERRLQRGDASVASRGAPDSLDDTAVSIPAATAPAETVEEEVLS
jgi:hypothetical protein